MLITWGHAVNADAGILAETKVLMVAVPNAPLATIGFAHDLGTGTVGVFLADVVRTGGVRCGCCLLRTTLACLPCWCRG